MKTLSYLLAALAIGTVGLAVESTQAATKKKVNQNLPTTVNTKTVPTTTTKTTSSPKPSRTPILTKTPAPARTPVATKTPDQTKTPGSDATAGKDKTPVPTKNVVLGDKLSSKAVSFAQPKMPDAAKAAGASGPVRVQVSVDERGRVLSVKPVSGNPLLQDAAVATARKLKFKPTLLSGTPVKVTGIVTYNFTQ